MTVEYFIFRWDYEVVFSRILLWSLFYVFVICDSNRLKFIYGNIDPNGTPVCSMTPVARTICQIVLFVTGVSIFHWFWHDNFIRAFEFCKWGKCEKEMVNRPVKVFARLKKEKDINKIWVSHSRHVFSMLMQWFVWLLNR